MPNRREFFTHALTLLSIAGLVDACAGSPSAPGSNAPPLPTVSGTLSGNTITVNVDPSSSLATVGNAALVQTTGGDVLVAHTAQNTFTALSAICTHQTCTITNYQSGTFVCPCHLSEFSTSGAVVQGPAGLPLRSYATQFSAPTLRITIA